MMLGKLSSSGFSCVQVWAVALVGSYDAPQAWQSTTMATMTTYHNVFFSPPATTTMIRRLNWSGCSGLVFTWWCGGFVVVEVSDSTTFVPPVRSARIGIHLSAYQFLDLERGNNFEHESSRIRIAHHERSSYGQNAWDFPSSKRLEDPTHTWKPDKQPKLK